MCGGVGECAPFPLGLIFALAPPSFHPSCTISPTHISSSSHRHTYPPSSLLRLIQRPQSCVFVCVYSITHALLDSTHSIGVDDDDNELSTKGCLPHSSHIILASTFGFPHLLRVEIILLNFSLSTAPQPPYIP